jgi:hypothetical protein
VEASLRALEELSAGGTAQIVKSPLTASGALMPRSPKPCAAPIARVLGPLNGLDRQAKHDDGNADPAAEEIRHDVALGECRPGKPCLLAAFDVGHLRRQGVIAAAECDAAAGEVEEAVRRRVNRSSLIDQPLAPEIFAADDVKAKAGDDIADSARVVRSGHKAFRQNFSVRR